MVLLLQSLSVRCKTRGTNFVSGRSTYPKNWMMFSVCQNTEKDTGSEPKTPGVSKIKKQEHSIFFCAQGISGMHLLFFAPFYFLLHLLYYIRNQQDATLAVSFISHCKLTLHVSDAFCVHHQEYQKV